MATTRVTFKGPFFDGRADLAVREFVAEVRKEVADQGLEDVHSQLHRVLKHPTGRYESRLRTEQRGDRWAVNDGPYTFIYGPWLEGTGSRNAPKTRFKGYATFRKVRVELRSKAKLIGERILQKYVRRMN